MELRCMRCSHYLGEAISHLELVGVVKTPKLRTLVEPPLDTRPCKCGWTNIFKTTLDGAKQAS